MHHIARNQKSKCCPLILRVILLQSSSRCVVISQSESQLTAQPPQVPSQESPEPVLSGPSGGDDAGGGGRQLSEAIRLSKGTVAQACSTSSKTGTSRSAMEGPSWQPPRLIATHWMWPTCCGPLPALRSGTPQLQGFKVW